MVRRATKQRKQHTHTHTLDKPAIKQANITNQALPALRVPVSLDIGKFVMIFIYKFGTCMLALLTANARPYSEYAVYAVFAAYVGVRGTPEYAVYAAHAVKANIGSSG